MDFLIIATFIVALLTMIINFVRLLREIKSTS